MSPKIGSGKRRITCILLSLYYIIAASLRKVLGKPFIEISTKDVYSSFNHLMLDLNLRFELRYTSGAEWTCDSF